MTVDRMGGGVRTKMTETEYKEQKERLSRYEKARDRIAVIAKVRALINNGILSINCAYDKHVDFDYLGDEFKKMLVTASKPATVEINDSREPRNGIGRANIKPTTRKTIFVAFRYIRNILLQLREGTI